MLSVLNFHSRFISPFIQFDYKEGSKICDIVTEAINDFGKNLKRRQEFSDIFENGLATVPTVSNISLNVKNCEDFPSDAMKEGYTLTMMDDPGNGKINIEARDPNATIATAIAYAQRFSNCSIFEVFNF